LTGWYVLG